jgi:hypothetical protein
MIEIDVKEAIHAGALQVRPFSHFVNARPPPKNVIASAAKQSIRNIIPIQVELHLLVFPRLPLGQQLTATLIGLSLGKVSYQFATSTVFDDTIMLLTVVVHE